MSDDRTIRIGPDGPDRSDERRNARVGTIVAVVLAALILGLFALRSGNDENEPAPPLASASATPATTSEPAGAPPTERPATPQPSPTDDGGEEVTEPTEVMPATSDVTAFLDAYEAEHGGDATTRLADLDFDDVEEIVAARVDDDAVQIDIAAWDGSRYVVTFSDTGGAAERLDDLVVRDVNGESNLEVVTFQSAGEQGKSISLWGRTADGSYERQDAAGGCWDGSNTYGIVGASVEAGRLEATCDGSPLPPEAWPSDVYEWEDGVWTYLETREPR